MTDAQLYLAVGLPALVALSGILTNVAFLLYLAGRVHRFEDKLDTFRDHFDSKLDILTGKVVDIDNRLIRIEPN